MKCCSNHKSTVINSPKAGSNVSYKDFNKSVKHPFLRNVILKVSMKRYTVSPNPNKSFTNKSQKHTLCGFCYYIKSSVADESNKLELYRGEDASQ